MNNGYAGAFVKEDTSKKFSTRYVTYLASQYRTLAPPLSLSLSHQTIQNHSFNNSYQAP